MKVLIINAWGGNRGDEAMINALGRLIKTSWPKADVDMMMFRDEILDVKADIRQLPSRVGVYGYSMFTGIFRQYSRIAERIKLPLRRRIVSVVLRAVHIFGFLDMSFIKRYDLVISAPQGPTISDMYNVKKQTIYPLGYALRFNVPYIIIGTSMGPFDQNSPSEEETFNVISGAKKILVREDISLHNVRSKYPDIRNIESAIDIVFTDSTKNLSCGKSVSFLKTLKEDAGKSIIGACISLTPARNPRNPFDRQQYVEQMSVFFAHVLQTTKGRMVLFPHLNFDVPYLQNIVERVGADRVTILPPDLDSDAQQEVMASLDFFISSRYHPTVFAIKAGVPFMCIINQFKTQGLLEKIGLNIPVCWQDDAMEKLISVFDDCWSGRSCLKASVLDSLRVARNEAEKYNNLFHNLMSDFSCD